jgi:Skp family chaperone for outer membrane proteins
VKTFHRLAILAVVVSLGYLFSLAVAQNPAAGRPAAPAGGPRLALLDVTKIFRSNTRFKSQMEELKRDVEIAEKRVKAERDDISHQVTEVLPQYQKGTQQYSELEEQLANRQAKLAVDFNRQKADFYQREATIHYNVYQEILRATDYFCKQNSIDMVLRFSGDLPDVQRPDSILPFIQKQVVWYDPGLDITEPILTDLNRQGGANPAAATRPASPFDSRR